MIRCLFEFKGLLSLVLLSLFLQTQPAFAAGSKLVILGTGNETRPDIVVNKENAISNRIAGAGVIGLAIGFGAQTLVKDIIAGLFFLLDDAFRVGDYIETLPFISPRSPLNQRQAKMRRKQMRHQPEPPIKIKLCWKKSVLPLPLQ